MYEVRIQNNSYPKFECCCLISGCFTLVEKSDIDESIEDIKKHCCPVKNFEQFVFPCITALDEVLPRLSFFLAIALRIQ